MMSTVSEKLLQVAQNNPKVYHSGQLNIVKNAECLKNNKSGSAILIDDVSPVTHEMGVRVRGKNLFDASKLQNGTFETYSDIPCFSFYDNANYFIYTDNFIKDTQYTFTMKAYREDGVINKPITFNLVYTDGTKQTRIINAGEKGSVTSIAGKTLTKISGNNGYGLKCYIDLSVTQIELGTTATAYTPYVPDLTAVKVSRYGKNLTNSLTDINAEQNSFVISRDNGIVTLGSKNVITYSSMAHLYDRILSAGTYTFSFDCTIENIKKCTKPNYVHLYVDDKFVANVIYNMNKDGTYHRSFNFKITKKSRVLIRFYFNIDSITEASDTIITKAMFSNVQLELGSTATDYEPYITPTEYTPTADGTVNGVTSLYPNTTLMNDTDGVLIDCEYYKDIDKTFNELTTSVALSGGDS